MANQHQNLDQLLDQAERIGVVGSPSSTSEMALDILATAVNKKLIGELALFRYLQDGLSHYALGQVTEVTLRNVWHEDPTMRSLIRQRGRVDAVSERQDTHLGEMTISAVFSASGDGYRPSILGTVPATGTGIHLANDELIGELLSPYRNQLFYLGNVYGSTPLLPLWFKHFDSGAEGAGDAYHLGIFGKTGSGKSVLAKMMLLAYARYPRMGLLVIDPQGEFAKDMRGSVARDGFALNLGALLISQSNRHVRVHGVRQLVLDTWDIFQHILAGATFFERLGIHTSDKRSLAAEVLRENLEGRVTLENLHTRAAFDRAWGVLQEDRPLTQIYSGRERRQELLQMIRSTDETQHFNDYWLPVARLFQGNREGAVTVNGLLGRVFGEEAGRPVVVLDLSRESAEGLFWNDTIQSMVIKRLINGISQMGERAYKENRRLNALVIIDEAHRLAPRETPQDEESQAVRAALVDASRTHRKYGLGWMFISQTLSSLNTEIVQQLRVHFFGFGLNSGSEREALREIAGKEALRLYERFRDPQSAFDVGSREYSFMTMGPVSPLSFAGTPLFFNAFNTPEAFLEANGFVIPRQLI